VKKHHIYEREEEEVPGKRKKEREEIREAS